jgi:hypothetical protein
MLGAAEALRERSLPVRILLFTVGLPMTFSQNIFFGWKIFLFVLACKGE